MEYGYPYNGCGGNKEKRPPLKRGQLKLQIARTLLGSLVAPGAKNRDRTTAASGDKQSRAVHAVAAI
ncbi:hypothetical protein GQ55_5G102400 [Panicum hallii var. hallii]|uniref:Uncharacterized protein n=1 Tax=Panicum hallii var. hallii TaxID=1504633 RepID=A0A2T7DEW5_9POAL|nr:hypothetical protein GQ55_5G102400 [Panicum hallii var. hallii]